MTLRTVPVVIRVVMDATSRRKLLSTLVGALTCGAVLVGGGPPAGAAPDRPAEAAVVEVAGLPRSPVAYATGAFEAWLRGDIRQLDRYAAGAVTDVLAARAPEATTGWGTPACEGAAGSTYCTWSRAEVTLTLRVANEAASAGRRDAVTSAAFAPAPGGVAIWPFVTAEEAANTQEQVDQGHSPWLVEPTAVASFYAGAELGWADAPVEAVRPGTYWVTDPATGARAELDLAQPARPGEGGIWAVTQARSVALG